MDASLQKKKEKKKSILLLVQISVEVKGSMVCFKQQTRLSNSLVLGT